MSLSLVLGGASLPLGIEATIPLFSKTADIFRSEAEITISIKSANYKRERKWLIMSKEKGARLELSIRGKPSFCQAMIELITGNQPGGFFSRYNRQDTTHLEEQIRHKLSSTEFLDYTEPSQMNVPWSVYWSDLFRSKCEFSLEVFGRDHKKDKMIVTLREQGSSMKITVRGKPGFAKAVADHLGLHTSKLSRLLLGA